MDNESLQVNEGKIELIEITALAFLSLEEVDKDVFRGGLLVTDGRGKPSEFRCTSPIQPNSVQKTLYGSTLKSHMSVELVGRPLIAALKEKPQIVLVVQEEFLELRTFIKEPVLFIKKQGSSMNLEEEGNKVTNCDLLISPTGKFEPVTATCHWNYENDIKIISKSLHNVFSVLDIVEPFSRISNALKLVQSKNVTSK